MIEIALLGPPQIRCADGAVCPTGHGSIELLAYLASRPGRSETRDRIAQTLWPDMAPDRQRACLSTAVWRLKQMFGDAGVDPCATLCVAPGRVSLPPGAPIRLDVEELRTAYRLLRRRRGRSLRAEEFDQLAAAVLLWRGEYMPGYDSEWTLVEQGGLVTAYQAILDRLVAYHAKRGQWRRSIDCAQSLLALDPLLEHAYRAAIEAHGALGERSRAKRIFDRCCALLLAELDVAPLPETVEAYHAALAQPRAAGTPPGERPEALMLALAELRSATRHLEELTRQR